MIILTKNTISIYRLLYVNKKTRRNLSPNSLGVSIMSVGRILSRRAKTGFFQA